MAPGKSTKAKRSLSKGTDWSRLRQVSPASIRAGVSPTLAAHPSDAAFWKETKIALPRRKAVVTMRLDADLLDWFRQERGYQTRINAILRTYMKAHTQDTSDSTTE